MCYGHMSAQLQSSCSPDTTLPHFVEQVVPSASVLQAGPMEHKPEKSALKFLQISFSFPFL